MSDYRLRIIKDEPDLLFQIKLNQQVYYHQEKYDSETLEEILKIVFQKIAFYPEKISPSFLRTIKKLNELNGRIITVFPDGQWSSENAPAEFRLIKEKALFNHEIKNKKDENCLNTIMLESQLKQVSQKPEDPDTHNNLGLIYTGLAKFSEAIDSFREAISLDNNRADFYFNLGKVYALSGNYNLAEIEYREGLRLNRENYLFFFELANILEHLSKLHEAVTVLHETIILCPDFIDAYLKLGDVYNKLNFPDEALYTFQSVLFIDPENTEVLNRITQTLVRKSKQQAADFNNLAIAYAERGKYDQAIDKFKQALDLNPNDAELHFNLAMVYLRIEKTEDALNSLQEAICLNKNFSEAIAEMKKIKLEKINKV